MDNLLRGDNSLAQQPMVHNRSQLEISLANFRNPWNLSQCSRRWIAGCVIAFAAVIGAGVFCAVVAADAVLAGGTIRYDAAGSPGPVVFRHSTHLAYGNGKYKECKTCHDKLFAAEKYGTYVLRALKNAPELKIHIGRDAGTLHVPDPRLEDESALITYEVPRACATCATGVCHDGKESFGRMDCLSCHQRK